MEFKSINPATGEVIKTYPQLSTEAAKEILRKSHEAFLHWSQTDFVGRRLLFNATSDVLEKDKDEFARRMANEMGKPLAQGIAEIEKCALCCRYYAEQAEEFLRPKLIRTEAEKSFVAFRPLGVILAIMPWNFPFWQVFRFAVPTLSAGNAAVLKHAANVQGCAAAIEEIFRRAGFPENLFRKLEIDHAQTAELIRDPLIAAVSMTSSGKGGKQVAAEAARATKKCVLELGGSDPFILLEDADLDLAVKTGIIARYQNSGQSCIAAKRFIVVESLREPFEKRFVEEVKKLRMGDPLESDNYLGPQARADLRDTLHRQVQNSVKKGAKLLYGGEIPEGPGAFYPATVLTEVKEGMPAWSEELFGPVASIIPAKDEAEAIRIANATDFGLGASIWTTDLARGERIATEKIEAGNCFVNGMTKSDPRLPFGGIKQSGYGRELADFGIHEFVNIKSVVVQPR